MTLDGAGNETGSPVAYVQPGVKRHWEIFTSGQTSTAYTGGTAVACTVDGIARACSTDAGLAVTPSLGEHTIVAKLVHSNEDVWATTTKRFTAGAPPTTSTTPAVITAPVNTPPVTPPPSPVAPTLTVGKFDLATIARKRAIAVPCAVNQPGRCRVTVTIDGKTAKRLRLTRSARTPYRLAAGSIAFSAAGTKTLRLAIAGTAAKRLRGARSLKLQFTITGEYATATRGRAAPDRPTLKRGPAVESPRLRAQADSPLDLVALPPSQGARPLLRWRRKEKRRGCVRRL